MQTQSVNTLRRGLHVVGSLWFAAVVLVLLLVAMACATVYESVHGSEQALLTFYQSSWFEALLFLLAANVLTAVVVRYPFSKRQIGFVMTHASILVILGGALVTKHFGSEGRVSILEGETLKEFHVSAETLALTNRANSTTSTVDLNPKVFGRLTVVERPQDASVALGDVRVRVEKYLPDSVPWERIVNDNPQPRAAVELSLASSGHDDKTWVLEGENAQFGPIAVALRTVATVEELKQLLEPSSEKAASSVGTVKIDLAGATVERPVEECMDKAVPIGGTGYSIRVLRYFNHATVGPNNEITNASDRPVNPAIRAEIIGPSGTEKRTAFARFPDFASMHKEPATPNLNLIFVASGAQAATEPTTPIEVLFGPADQLRLRFTAADGIVTTQEARLGEPVETPWPGRRLTIAQRFDHASMEHAVTLADPIRETRMPAVLLKIEAGGESSEIWLGKSQPRRLTIDRIPYELLYAEKQVPFGFSIALTKFTVGTYPGGNRPRSFESQVTITDPANGRTQGRIISMNHPTSYGGYTLYQSSYQLTGERATSVLSVARDPGQPIVFAGYFGLLAGMIVVLGVRVTDQRRLQGGDDSAHGAGRGNGRQTISLLNPGERRRQQPPSELEPSGRKEPRSATWIRPAVGVGREVSK